MAESLSPFLYFPEAGGPACALVQPSTIVREGFLLKRKEEPAGLATRFAFKKRYFRLSGRDLSYSKTPEWQVRLHHAPPPPLPLEQLFQTLGLLEAWGHPGPRPETLGILSQVWTGGGGGHKVYTKHRRLPPRGPSVLPAPRRCVSGYSTT